MCYYHPMNISEIVCEKCNKHICLIDKRTYRKKHGWFRGRNVYYTNHTYCIYCLISQLKDDFSHQLRNLIFIPFLMVFLLILYARFPDTLFVGSKNLLALGLFFIGFPVILIGGPVIAYMKIIKAETDEASYSTSFFTPIDVNDNNCYYHPENVAISICKSCKKRICNIDLRKMNSNSKDTYCILCYANNVRKRANPLIYLSILSGFEIIFYFLFQEETNLSNASFGIPFMLLLNVCIIAFFIFIYIYVYNKNKKAKQDAEQFKSYLINRASNNNFSSVTSQSFEKL